VKEISPSLPDWGDSLFAEDAIMSAGYPIIGLRINWDFTAIPLNIDGFHMLHIGPEVEYPFGRKGLAITRAWQAMYDSPDIVGLIILDGDVVIDPLDQAAMHEAINNDPDIVHVAPAKLWPVSTKVIDNWVWGHGKGEFSQSFVNDPDIFSFCYTYLPKELVIASISAGMPKWTYPTVDKNVSLIARKMGLKVNVVMSASPKHIHY
jgi:hypothetical protein